MKPANGLHLKKAQLAAKYPSEEECFVRRFGSALLACWDDLPEDLREKILAEAESVWDRELDIPHIGRKLDCLIKRYRARLSKI
jgi:hypothetical protein